MRVSRSGYYKYLLFLKRKTEEDLWKKRIVDCHQKSRGTYGYRRVTQELKSQGFCINKKRVSRLMQILGLRGVGRQKGKRRTVKRAEVKPNFLAQDFKAYAPNQIWATDITEVPVHQGKLYLCTILDLFSRRIVGWALKDHMRAELVIGAFQQAFARRGHPKGLVVHSDQGSQFGSEGVQKLFRQYHVWHSMSGKGMCYDNAPTESSYATLKSELLYGLGRCSEAVTRSEVFAYIEGFYNVKSGLAPTKKTV
jgi:transposase InsO family protein